MINKANSIHLSTSLDKVTLTFKVVSTPSASVRWTKKVSSGAKQRAINTVQRALYTLHGEVDS